MKVKKLAVLFISMLMMSVMAFSQVKIGVADFQVVVQKSKKGKAIRVKLEGLQKQKQQQAKDLQGRIDKLQKDLLSPALNAGTRASKTEELNQVQLRLKRFMEDSQRELQREFQKELLALEKLLLPVLRNIGKTNGYTAIFDLGKGGMAYYDQSIDLTNQVIQAFDAKYPN
jgi:Skp family chaperone for outer membrane proteins